MPYQPPMRLVVCRLATVSGWMRARVPLAVAHSLLDHLEHGGPFVNLVDAELPGWADRAPYFALQRQALSLLVPDDDDHVETPSGGPGEDHRARFLLDQGYLTGLVRLVKGTRLSSFLGHHGGFFAVHDAALHRTHEADPVHFPIVLVNAARLVGVVDNPQPAQPAR